MEIPPRNQPVEVSVPAMEKDLEVQEAASILYGMAKRARKARSTLFRAIAHEYG